jgi:hypothetical protein
MDLFDVYVLRFDVNEDRATRALMQVFGLSEAAARIFVHSVPRVGKRDVPTPMAERYVRALHAVGAVVECRRSGTSPLGGDNSRQVPQMSLPAPAESSYAEVSRPPTIMQDSLGIMAPLAYAPDMPQIPKAPRVPADLHHIRARKGPDSLAPNWRSSTRDGGRDRNAAVSFASASAEPGIWSADPRALQLSSDPMTALHDDVVTGTHEREILENQEAAVKRAQLALQDRMTPRAPSSPTPLSPSPFAASERTHQKESTPWYATATHQLLLAAVIIAGMGIALSTGVFDTDVNPTQRAFEQAGIQAGVYEPAERYLSQPESRFQSLPADQLQALVTRLSQAGAREIWVADIRQQNGQRTSRTLLLDLPQEPAARRTLFEELAGAQRAGQRSVVDSGQRFLRVDF